MDYPNIPIKLRAIIRNEWFIFKEKIKFIFWKGKKVSILFPEKEVWDVIIKKSFRYTKHEVHFGDLTIDNIRLHSLVVPLSYKDLDHLVEIAPLLKGNPIPIPSRASVDLCNDKFRFNTTLTEKGFGQYVPRVANKLSFPYLLKKKEGEYGVGSLIIKNATDEMLSAHLTSDANYFCQELVSDQNEYATHIIFKNGEILCSMSVKYTFRDAEFINGKNKYICREVTKCPHLEIFSSILLLIEFEGICCFDYKIKEGRPVIFEINPRFGGSLTNYFVSFVRHIWK